MSSSHEIFFTSSPNRPITAYDFFSGTTVARFSGSRSPCHGLVLAGKAYIDASHISSVTSSGSIHLYNWWSSTAFHHLPVSEPIAHASCGVIWMEQTSAKLHSHVQFLGFLWTQQRQNFYAAGADGLIYKGFLKVGSRKEVTQMLEVETCGEKHGGEIISVVIMNEGKNLVSATEDGSVYLWEVEKVYQISKGYSSHRGCLVSGSKR
ncbi:hypothetical protein Peur_023760 [Populus x canadensis]